MERERRLVERERRLVGRERRVMEWREVLCRTWREVICRSQGKAEAGTVAKLVIHKIYFTDFPMGGLAEGQRASLLKA
jgi:hypothetical protein